MVSEITGRHRHGKIGELEQTLSYNTAQADTRIFELENRCTGNRTVSSNPSPPHLLESKGFSSLFDFQGTNGGPRLTLSRGLGD